MRLRGSRSAQPQGPTPHAPTDPAAPPSARARALDRRLRLAVLGPDVLADLFRRLLGSFRLVVVVVGRLRPSSPPAPAPTAAAAARAGGLLDRSLADVLRLGDVVLGVLGHREVGLRGCRLDGLGRRRARRSAGAAPASP
jgi:hypothetical protein